MSSIPVYDTTFRSWLATEHFVPAGLKSNVESLKASLTGLHFFAGHPRSRFNLFPAANGALPPELPGFLEAEQPRESRKPGSRGSI